MKRIFQPKEMLGTFKKLFKSPNTEQDNGLITILYGGKSGNAQFVASETFRHLKENGKKVRLKNLSSYKAENLVSEKTVLFVVSTHGEGEPPPAALRFFQSLNRQTIALFDLCFSVCALGDSEYDHYCKAGKDLEKRLSHLGARSISPRKDCDASLESAAAGWISEVSKILTHSDATEPVSMKEIARDWHTGIIREKRQLNQGSDAPVFHISLAIDDAQVRYQTGDSVGIIPQNPISLVNRVLEKLQILPFMLVDTESGLTLREFLLSKAEITNLSKGQLERYSQLSGDENLADLINNTAACNEYLQQRDFLDLLTDFPVELHADRIPFLLDKIKVRYYSIASFQPTNPGEIHLTIKQVRFQYKDRLRQGSCSNYLSVWLETGTAVSFFVSRDENFRLPANPEVPVIFIAAGTGIAPVRAFMQEREARQAHKNRLIFGEKTRRLDFLYQTELEDWATYGVLDKLDLAFSRDQVSRVYVQDILLRKGQDVLKWLNAGAVIYVCGSIKMGSAVKAVLDSVLTSVNDELSVAQLKAGSRYFEDIY